MLSCFISILLLLLFSMSLLFKLFGFEDFPWGFCVSTVSFSYELRFGFSTRYLLFRFADLAIFSSVPSLTTSDCNFFTYNETCGESIGGCSCPPIIECCPITGTVCRCSCAQTIGFSPKAGSFICRELPCSRSIGLGPVMTARPGCGFRCARSIGLNSAVTDSSCPCARCIGVDPMAPNPAGPMIRLWLRWGGIMLAGGFIERGKGKGFICI
mmetsp:Transcript_989/g.2538  ORF Transcript_989/g.2538 Transcript_989/m.2538 type:complete len:212 (+) Transcript_989:2521-3156(+)